MGASLRRPYSEWRFSSLKQKFADRRAAVLGEWLDNPVTPDEIISPTEATKPLRGVIDAAEVEVEPGLFGATDLASVLAEIAARLEALECATAWVCHEQTRSG